MESDVRPPKKLCVTEDEFENYDVFISHRGLDTKTGFVGFLYQGLKDAGLRPFLDCKSIGKGQDSWKCIDHAIKTTPIAVVIFSESFTQSERCLNELHVMLDTPGVKVLPIFYKVAPWEVSRPGKGQLAAGFKKLKQRHDEVLIDQWRADLSQASKLNGWEHKVGEQGRERELVAEIVGKIFELANKRLLLDVGEYVVGVEQVGEEIVEILNGRKEVLLLGLWGMGGIGKSTLARELYNRLAKRFDSSCFVEDVTEKVIEGGVVEVQNRILKDLCKNESEQIEDKSKGKIILQERLCKKRILLVLDDVRDSDEMGYWITRKMLKEGSMCIVTSRDRRVFEKSNSFDVNHEMHIHDVQLLSSEDSKQVFTSNATGGRRKAKLGFEKLVADISKACGGVPLVLKVCGALLKDEENVDIWEKLLGKLKCGSIMDEKKIFECLRISYDALQWESREMFLDIACALLGRPQDMAKRVWESQGCNAALGVRSLVEKALITLDKDGCFAMHDHLRDMGRQIVKNRSDGVLRSIWMPESLALLGSSGTPLPFAVLRKDEPILDSLQTLIISNYGCMYENDNPTLDLDVSQMKELRILICDNNINVTSTLPKKLHWFEVTHQRLRVSKSLPTVPRNNKLVVFILQSSNIETLPESLPRLLCNLEVFNLNDCKQLSMLPNAFGDLKKLTNLNIGGSVIESLPDSFGELSNLEVLNLRWCSKLTRIPDMLAGLRKLREFDLGGSRIESLPNSFGELSNLEVLDLRLCSKLSRLPDMLAGLKKLRDFDLGGSGIESLPDSFGELSNLEVLNVRCSKLTRLPDMLAGLKKLRDFDLEGSGIESLPNSFGELSNLEVLNLSWCSKLTRLPDMLAGLKKLRDFDLGGFGIESLPNSFGELSNLEVLNLSWCYKLTRIPDTLAGLKKLRDFDLKGSGIESLPDSFGELSNLEVLNVRKCAKLTRLPDMLAGLRKLRDFDLGGSGIESLPNSFGELSNLEVLNLRWCSKLTRLPDMLAGLKKLREFDLGGFGIESLPNSFGELSNLEVLNLSWCYKLTRIPDTLAGLKKLRDFDLKGSGIESLPDSFGELSNLEVLNVRKCAKLTRLPDMLAGLRKLRDFDLGGSGIESLPNSFGELSNLEVLDLRLCSKLTRLPDMLAGLKKLRDFDLGGSGIESLPDSFGELSNLEVLNLRWCSKLTRLPDMLAGLKKLREFDLGESGIESLPDSFGELRNLEVLNLRRCAKLTRLPDILAGLRTSLPFAVLKEDEVDEEDEEDEVDEEDDEDEEDEMMSIRMTMPPMVMPSGSQQHMQIPAIGPGMGIEPMGPMTLPPMVMPSGSQQHMQIPAMGPGMEIEPMGPMTLPPMVMPSGSQQHMQIPAMGPGMGIEPMGPGMGIEPMGPMTLPPMVMPSESQQHMQILAMAPGMEIEPMGLGMEMVPLDPGMGMYPVGPSVWRMDLVAQRQAVMPMHAHAGSSINAKMTSWYQQRENTNFLISHQQEREDTNCQRPQQQREDMDCPSHQQLLREDTNCPSQQQQLQREDTSCSSHQQQQREDIDCPSHQLQQREDINCPNETLLKATMDTSTFPIQTSEPPLMAIVSDLFDMKSNDSIIKALEDEIMGIGCISTLLSNDSQNLLHSRKTTILCCFKEKENLFEFHFEDCESMGGIVGVGLEHAKVNLVEGWQVKVIEISKQDWQNAWKNSESTSNILKLTFFVPEVHQDNVEYVEEDLSFIRSGRPLLWDIAKYFILEATISSISLRDISGTCANKSSGAPSNSQTTNDKSRSSSGGNDSDNGHGHGTSNDNRNGDNNGNNFSQRLVQAVKTIFFGEPSNLLLKKDEDDPHGDPLNNIDIHEVTTVYLELLPGGCIVHENSGTNEIQRLRSQLDNTIHSQLKFIFTVEPDVKEIQVTVGPISFQFGKENDENYIETGRFGWFHNSLDVSFRPKNSDRAKLCTTYKALDVEKGIETYTVAATQASMKGSEKLLNLGGEVSASVLTFKLGTDLRLSESNSKSSNVEKTIMKYCDYIQGGFYITQKADLESSNLRYKCHSPNYMIDLDHVKLSDEAYRNHVDTFPIRIPQNVKFQGTWQPDDVESEPQTMVEYIFEASRVVQMTDMKRKSEVMKKRCKSFFKSGKEKVEVEENIPLQFKQTRGKQLYLNHAMTHLCGKVYKLRERMSQRPLNETEPETYLSQQQSLKVPSEWSNNPLLTLNCEDLRQQP